MKDSEMQDLTYMRSLIGSALLGGSIAVEIEDEINSQAHRLVLQLVTASHEINITLAGLRGEGPLADLCVFGAVSEIPLLSAQLDAMQRTYKRLLKEHKHALSLLP